MSKHALIFMYYVYSKNENSKRLTILGVILLSRGYISHYYNQQGKVCYFQYESMSLFYDKI